MKITIYGASDDLIEFEGDIYDEFNWYDTDPWLAKLVAPNGERLLVSAVYRSNVSSDLFDNNGLPEDVDWFIQLLPDGEDAELPEWGYTYYDVSPEVDYSNQVTIIAPDGTRLEHISHQE